MNKNESFFDNVLSLFGILWGILVVGGLAYGFLIVPIYSVIYSCFSFLGEETANIVGTAGTAIILTAVAVNFIMKTLNKKKIDALKIEMVTKLREAENIKIETKNKENEIANSTKRIEEYFNQKESHYRQVKENIIKEFECLSTFIADLNTLEYELSEKYLKSKKQPAIKEAKRINELKKETKEYIKQLKLMQYKYDYLFKLFPELESYLEDCDCVDEGQFESLEDFDENFDRVRNYMTRDEYEQLPENDRNQLALSYS